MGISNVKASAPAPVDDIVAAASEQAAVDAEARQGIVSAMSLLGFDTNTRPVAGNTRVTVQQLTNADTGDTAAATLRRAWQDHRLSIPKAPSVGATADMIVQYATDITAWSVRNKELESLVKGLSGDGEPTTYPIAVRYAATPTNRANAGGNYAVYCIASDGVKGATDVLSDRVESHMVRDGKGMPLFFRHRSQGTIAVAVTPQQASNDLDALTKAIEQGINRRYLALCKIQDHRQALKATTTKLVAETHA